MEARCQVCGAMLGDLTIVCIEHKGTIHTEVCNEPTCIKQYLGEGEDGFDERYEEYLATAQEHKTS